MDAILKLKINTLVLICLLVSALLCDLCVGSCTSNGDNSISPYLELCDNEEVGSGEEVLMVIGCPIPDCVSVTVLEDLQTIEVDFRIMCLPVPRMECVYNYTVDFFTTPSQDVLLSSDSRVLSDMELNNTMFNVTPASLREGATSFEMGVFVVVSVGIEGDSISGNATVPGDFAPAILNLTVTNVSNTSISLSWDLPFPAATPDNYRIFYNFTELEGTDRRTGENSFNISLNDATDTTVTGLLPFTEYQISVATNYGEVLSSNVTTINQTEEGVSSPVTDLTVRANLTTMNFTISWEKPRFPAGIISQYEVSVSQNQSTTILKLTVFSKGLQVSSGFEFFVEYTFSVVPVNGFGPGEVSNITMVTSPEGAPTPPIGFTLEQVPGSPTTLMASWDQPSTLNGELTSYSVSCRVASQQFYPEQEPDTEEMFTLRTTVDQDTISTILTGLIAFTRYDCYVTASTNGGESQPSNNETARTDEDTPSAPVNFTSSEITATNVRLNWSRPDTPNGIITEYLVEYTNDSLDDPLEISIPVEYDTSSNEYNVTSLLVEHLNEATVYTFNISAITGSGRGLEATIENTTREAAPSAAPLNLRGRNSSSTSLLISWSPPPDQDQNGEITGYNISFFSNDNDSSSINTTETMINITGLLVFTDYNVSVAARTSEGIGPFDSIIVRTDSAVPEAPQNLDYRNLTSTSIRVFWDPPVTFNGPNEGYMLTYRRTETNVSNTTELMDTSVNITGLEIYEVYIVEVVALSDKGPGEPVTISILTDEDVPGIVTGFSADEVDLNTISVQWGPPSEPNGIITQYEVEYTLVENITNITRTLNISASNFTGQIELTNLQIFSEYDIRVRAYTSIGPGDYTNIVRVRTDPAPASPPTQVMTTPMKRSILLSWSEPERPHGVIMGYYILTNATRPESITVSTLDTNLEVLNVSSDVLSINFTNLIPFTVYEFSVAAYSFQLMDENNNFRIITGNFSDTEVTRTLEDSPTPPTNFALEQVPGSPTTLMASWDQPSTLNGELTSYSVSCRVANQQFYPEQEPDTEKMFTLQTTVDQETISTNLTDLIAFTRYDCYVTARTNGGESQPSNNETAQTDEDTPSAPVNFTSSEITATSVRLSWRRPDTPNGIITEYLVEYTNDSLDDPLEISIPVEYDTSSNEYNVTSLLVEHLNEATVYTFNISAITDGGRGVEATIENTTREAAPSAAPLNLRGTNSSSTSLLISWSPPPDQDQNGEITGYNISYFSNDDISSSISTTETMINITGLLVFTDYNVSVAARTSEGIGPFDSIIVRTDSAVPTAPQNLDYRNLTSSSVQVFWDPPETFNGPNEGYMLTYRRTETNVSNTTELMDTSVNITGLEIYEVYIIEVVALSDKGPGVSVMISVLTDEDVPGIVTGFSADEVDLNTIAVQWGPPSEPNGIITQYEVEYTLVENITNITRTLNISASNFTGQIELMNLQIFSEYDIRVRAYTSIGPGDYTNIVRVRTDPAPASPPTQVMTTPMKRSILLSWSEPERPHGVIMGYYILTNATRPESITVSTLDTNLEVLNVSSDVLSINFTNLTPFTVYEFSVAAYSFQLMDENNNFRIITGNFSDTEVTRTLEDSPTPPTNFTLEQVPGSPTTLMASWDQPSTLNGELTSYSVSCRVASQQFYPEQEPDTEEMFTLQTTVDQDTISTDLTGLNAFTSYDCYVTARTNGGESQPSNNETARTDEDTPSAPVNFTYIKITATSVRLDWSRPDTPNGIITEYLVEYTNDSLDDPLEISIPVEYDTSSNEYNVTSLLVEHLNEATVYTFNISAITDGGRGLEATIEITTREAAPSAAPLNLRGTNSSSTSLLISWSPPPDQDQNGEITGYNISYFSNDDDSISISTTETMINITGLLVFTDYNVSVAARTSEGIGPFDSIIVRTDSAVPEAPQNLDYRNLTSTSIRVFWDPPVTFNGPNEGYMVTYRRTETNISNTTELMDTSVNITDLEIYEVYIVEVVALSDKGPGESVMISVLTDEDAPTPPIGFTLEQVPGSPTTLMASWDQPSTLNGELTSYSVSCRVASQQFYPEQEPDTEEMFTLRTTVDQDTISTDLTGLIAFTRYDCYVTASTNGGESQPSNNETAQTDEDTPSAPVNFASSEITATNVRLNWSRPDTPNGIITEYLVEYTNDSLDDPLEISIPVEYDTSSNEYNVTSLLVEHLNEATVYTFNISAITDGGRGLEATIEITTREAAPSAAPLNLRGRNSSSTSLLISWSPPPDQDRNGEITGYIISYFSNDDDSISISTTETMIDITGLLVFTVYNVSVAARTSEGTGPFDSIIVRTDSAVPEAPQNLDYRNLTSTSIRVFWDPPETFNGPNEGYMVTYRRTETNVSNTTERMDTSVNITGLEIYEVYVVEVVALSDKGPGESVTIMVLTDEDAPSAGVRDLSVDVLNSTTVNVSWLPPPRADWNGLITEYNVSYTSNDTTVPSSLRSSLSGAVSLSGYLRNGNNPRLADDPLEREYILVSNLEEFINYQFIVTVATAIGTNPEGDTPPPVQAKTMESAPNGPPINVTVIVLNSLTANISWAPPLYLDRNGIISSYSVEISHRLGKYYDTTKSTFFRATGLPQFAEFSVQVSATNSQGSGPLSDIVTNTTFEGLPSPPRNIILDQRGETSIEVRWSEPNPPNGIIQGYHIFYFGSKANGDTLDGLNENLTATVFGNVTTRLLEGLLGDTTFSVNVTAFTGAGNGTTGIGGNITLPPGTPPPLGMNFTVSTPTRQPGEESPITDTTINIEFIIPAALNSNGPILRVRIIIRVYESSNDTLTTYYESSRANPPNSPPYFALEVSISDQRKRGLVKRQANGEEIVSETIGNQLNCGPNDSICNGPLRPNTEYQFKYRAYNSENNSIFAESDYSAPIKTERSPQSSSNSNTTVVVAVVIVIVFVMVIVVAGLTVIIILCRRKKLRNYSFRGNGVSDSLLHANQRASLTKGGTLNNAGPTIVPLSETMISNARSNLRPASVKAMPHSRKVYLRDLPGYVQDMMSDSGFKFSEEYEKVSAIGLDHSKDASLMPENRAKNRYTNILAYDHSRVKLDYVDDEPGSDYINANYIPGYKVRRAYIATQGPLPSTFDDFWTMIWEQNAHNIVMLTQLVERGRTKCHRYWPGSQPEVYGDVTVEMISEKELNDWITRIFELRKEKRTRTVYHYQFISWPDHGVPEAATAALDFVRCVHENIQSMHGPVVVHCSAGVGRTGTFIALGTLLQHIKDHDWIDVFGLACEMRQHRNHMIQTEAQYIFIHKAMVEVCESLSTFSIGKQLHNFNPIYVNVCAGSSPGISQQSDTVLFGNALLSEETTHSQLERAYQESRF